MNNLRTLPAKNPIEVEVVDVQGPSHLADTVIVNPRPARAAAAVGAIELVAIASWSALIHVSALIVDVPAGKIVLYELGDGAALDEGCQHLDRQT